MHFLKREKSVFTKSQELTSDLPTKCISLADMTFHASNIERTGWTPLSGRISNYFFMYFCKVEFDGSAHMGIGNNGKLSGDNKRTLRKMKIHNNRES